MTNPFRIEGPALISFSGGRTSAYMLKQVVDAYDGKLPDDVYVCFANTGKEREETLRFVYECGIRWGVHIHWLEWRSRLKSTPITDRFEEVGLNSAARKGEPFKALIDSKKALPNAVMRWCTEHLKMQVLADFMESRGHATWNNVVGLRADELRRVVKKDRQNEAGANAWVTIMPLVKARVGKPDVRRFWFGKEDIDLSLPAELLPQGFDLGLEEWEGNCDNCMLKPKAVLAYQERLRPGTADWWIEQETATGARFVTEYSFSDIKRDVERQPLLIALDAAGFEYDAECGVSGVDNHIRCGARR